MNSACASRVCVFEKCGESLQFWHLLVMTFMLLLIRLQEVINRSMICKTDSLLQISLLFFWNEMEIVMIIFSLLGCMFKRNSFLNEKECRAEVDCVHLELFGLLSFANCCNLIIEYIYVICHQPFYLLIVYQMASFHM